MKQRGRERREEEIKEAESNERWKAADEWHLVEYEALPDYLKDNEYIRNYYRSEWPLKALLFSIFSWHNETLNIWTHVSGFILFLCLTAINLMKNSDIQHISSSYNLSTKPGSLKSISSSVSLDQALTALDKTITTVPQWPWFVFLSGAMVCLSGSALTHLLHSHSRRANFFLWSLDYTGISVMIISSFFPGVYYAFLCHPTAQRLYLTAITLLGLLAILTLVAPGFSSARLRPLRGGIFLAMGFSGVVPFLHALIINWEQPHTFIVVAYEVSMAMAYATGAAVYLSRIPERWRPGAFDITGHSHQIFHIFVILGALAHYAAVRILMNWRGSDGGTCRIVQ